MTLAPDVEPIKIGVLMDIISRRDGEPSETMKDLLDPFACNRVEGAMEFDSRCIRAGRQDPS